MEENFVTGSTLLMILETFAVNDYNTSNQVQTTYNNTEIGNYIITIFIIIVYKN